MNDHNPKGVGMRKAWIFVLMAAFILCAPSFAQPKSLDWTGTYLSKETTLVALKRLTFFREKDGTLKAQGALVGFPDEVSIGEATAEIHQHYPSKGYPDRLILCFNSAEKYKPVVVIEQFGWDNEHPTNLQTTIYLKNVNGSKVFMMGNLERQK